ncbi:uncharacterized protein LOC116427257 [Nomia melanderi]|uniref:uncharacterized protein LOC116427257 n=1 Tax=Nomia melanderi TaxID=2448451 RepID=UPI003FCCD1E9
MNFNIQVGGKLRAVVFQRTSKTGFVSSEGCFEVETEEWEFSVLMNFNIRIGGKLRVVFQRTSKTGFVSSVSRLKLKNGNSRDIVRQESSFKFLQESTSCERGIAKNNSIQEERYIRRRRHFSRNICHLSPYRQLNFHGRRTHRQPRVSN